MDIGNIIVQGGLLGRERDNYEQQQKERGAWDEDRAHLRVMRDMGVQAQQGQAEIQRAGIDDLRRTRANDEAYRGVAAANTGSMPGSLEAMAAEAQKRGDLPGAMKFQEAHRKLKQEGMIDVTRAVLSGADTKEIERLYGAAGQDKFDEGSAKVVTDPRSGATILTGTRGGQPFTYNASQGATLLGIVKPDNNLKDNFQVIKDAQGNEALIDLKTARPVVTTTGQKDKTFKVDKYGKDGEKVGESVVEKQPDGTWREVFNGAQGGAGGTGGDKFSKYDLKIFNEIDDHVKTLLGANAMNSLDPKNEQRFQELKESGKGWFLANKDTPNAKNITPEVAVKLADEYLKGRSKMVWLTDPQSGAVKRGMQYGGVTYFYDRDPVDPAFAQRSGYVAPKRQGAR